MHTKCSSGKTNGHTTIRTHNHTKDLHRGQYGCRKRRSCVDAVAVMLNRARTAWGERKIAGALLMDVKSAFNNVARGHLVRRLESMGIEPDMCRWVESFMTDRNVRIVIDGTVGQDRAVETGIQQGSPVSPILFAVYISGVFEEVERKTGAEGLPFVGDVAWVATGKDVEGVTAKLEACVVAAEEWAQANAVSFDKGKTEAVLFRKGRKEMPARKIWVGNHQVAYNKEATRWLGVYLDCSLTLKEHHRTRMRKARQAEGRLRRLTGQFGLTPEHCRRIQVACVQATALFGSELWWTNGRGVKGQANDTQLMVNRQARSTPVATSQPTPAHSWDTQPGLPWSCDVWPVGCPLVVFTLCLSVPLGSITSINLFGLMTR